MPGETNTLRKKGLAVSHQVARIRAMKKKHIYNALICMGLFMRTPEVA